MLEWAVFHGQVRKGREEQLRLAFFKRLHNEAQRFKGVIYEADSWSHSIIGHASLRADQVQSSGLFVAW